MPSDNEVEITLGDTAYTLKPSLRAARLVSAMDGFVGAYQRLQRFDFATFVAIIAAGLPQRSPADMKALEEEVFATGVDPLFEPLTKFVNMLMSGGRDPAAGGASKAGSKN